MAKATPKRLPRGIRNNNPLNIRRSRNRWLGKLHDPTDREFEQFDTVEHGIRAAFIIIRTYITKYHCDRVASIIARFAPAAENNVEAYTHDVCTLAGIWHNEPLFFTRRSQMTRLLYAMHIHENGREYIPMSTFDIVYCTYFLTPTASGGSPA